MRLVPCGWFHAGGGAVAEEVGIGRVAGKCRFCKLLVSDTEAAERPPGPDRWLTLIRRTVVAQRTQPSSLAACSSLPEFGAWQGVACIALYLAWLTIRSCAGRKPAAARRRPGAAACRRSMGTGYQAAPVDRDVHTRPGLAWMATASQ